VQIDLPPDELAAFRYSRAEPADFDEFWADTLANAGDTWAPIFETVDTEMRTVVTIDVTFAGHGGAPIKAWLLLPVNRLGPLPVIVEYVGYGGGRGMPLESLAYASAGFAHLIMDTRGQGSAWRTGETPDPGGSGPAIPGYMTRGLLNRETYYYRRLYTDAYRIIDVIREHEAIDPSRIVVTGRSQGGGLSLAVAGLRDDIALAVPHVPFLCAFERGLRMTEENPYGELARWMATHRDRVDEALTTLDYFDGVFFARRARCPGLFSVGLNDPISPPSTVYAAHNEYGGPADMTVWRYNAHEAGGPYDQLRTIRAAREL
jgi:cephalosporin-C deacetylase